MASVYRATAKDLLEHTRRLAGDCEPPQLARLAINGVVRYARRLRGWPVDDTDHPGEAAARQLTYDATFRSTLNEPDGLGCLWQAINEPILQRAFASAGKGAKKLSADEIPFVTQLFTPRFVVEELLAATLIRSTGYQPVSGGAELAGRDRSPWDTAGHGLVARATEMRILDPACGTMNFGVAAIDVLRRLYRDEGDFGSEREIDRAILTNNLFGIDIDPFTLELASHALAFKVGFPLDDVPLNLYCGDALLESTATLSRTSIRGGATELPKAFDVVLTNPPYLSARNAPTALVKRWKKRYPNAFRDAYACFIERALQFLKPGGRAGLLTMQSFMFTGSYQPLRESIAQRAAIERITHFGPGLFDTGNPGTLQTAAFVLRREEDAGRREPQRVQVRRLVDVDDKQSPGERFELTQRELRSSPRSAWIYWLSPAERNVFAALPKLGDTSPPRQGLATTDNARFVRYWWEVSPFSPHANCAGTPGRWTPYVKAGQQRRWYESPRHRVNWQDDGAEIKASIVAKYPYLEGKWAWVAKNADYYGRPGVTYSYLTSGQFSARQLPAGAIFDVAGSSLFPDDPLTTLAVLNSSVARRLLAAINPTVNFQVGDLAELPVPPRCTDELRSHVAELIDLHRQVDQWDETAPDFQQPPAWPAEANLWTATLGRIRALEHLVDTEVADCYGLPVADDGGASLIDLDDFARRSVSHALTLAMADREWAVIDDDLAEHVRRQLEVSSPSSPLLAVPDMLELFLTRDFAPWHNRLYRMRPRWWVFGARSGQVLIAHDRADRRTLGEALRQIGETVPAGWERHVDDGIAVNLSPLRTIVSDRALRRALAKSAADVESLRWSRTYRTTTRFIVPATRTRVIRRARRSNLPS